MNAGRTIERRELMEALRVLDRRSGDAQVLGRRSFTRHQVRAEAVIAPLAEQGGGESRGVEVHLRDISRGGLAALTPTTLALGRPYRLSVVEGSTEVWSLLVSPRHIEQLSPTVQLIGFVFVVDAGVMVSLGVPADALRLAEPGAGESGGEFLPVEAA